MASKEDPNAKPLSLEELNVALRDNVNVHREFIKQHTDPPIDGQDWSLVSFRFLQTPLMLPDNELFYGWVKLRGNYSTDGEAEKRAEHLLQYFDSQNKNRIVKTGAWVPLTSSKLLTKEFHEFSDQRFKQKIIEAEKKQQEEIKQVREREEKLKQGIDQFDEDSLDYYIVKKVSLAENEYTLEQALKRVKECRSNLDRLNEEIERLEKEHPEYIEEALPKYNEERKDAGLEEVVSFQSLQQK